jgi:hypothetical protein
MNCFGSIKASKGTQQYQDYQTARLQLNSLKAFIKRREEAAAHKDFFMSSSTRYIDEQRRVVLEDFRALSSQSANSSLGCYLNHAIPALVL